MFFQSFSLSISVQLFPSLISHLPSHHKNKPDVTNTTNPQPLPPPTPAPLPPSNPPPLRTHQHTKKPSYPSTNVNLPPPPQNHRKQTNSQLSTSPKIPHPIHQPILYALPQESSQRGVVLQFHSSPPLSSCILYIISSYRPKPHPQRFFFSFRRWVFFRGLSSCLWC